MVTGTLVSGTIHKEDELEVFPSGQRVRVRGIQVHGQAAEQAVAGQRTALNLAGVTTQEMARGMVLAPPSTFHAASRLDVSLTLLPSAKPLKDRARVHLHAYTFETIATVVLFSQKSGQKQVSPGETAMAQLRLADPTLLLPGDRFIVRQFSPVVTIGGGVVLDASPHFSHAWAGGVPANPGGGRCSIDFAGPHRAARLCRNHNRRADCGNRMAQAGD